MGRKPIYKTDEERVKAIQETKKRSYEKLKAKNRDMYRLSSLRSYYRKKLETAERLAGAEGLRPENKEPIEQKISELTRELQALKTKANSD